MEHIFFVSFCVDGYLVWLHALLIEQSLNKHKNILVRLTYNLIPWVKFSLGGFLGCVIILVLVLNNSHTDLWTVVLIYSNPPSYYEYFLYVLAITCYFLVFDNNYTKNENQSDISIMAYGIHWFSICQLDIYLSFFSLFPMVYRSILI